MMPNADRFHLLRKTFAILASAELGESPNWCPANENDLLTRIETLVILMNVMPRAELGRLDEVMRRWSELPESTGVSVGELREAAREVLQFSPLQPGVLVKESSLQRASAAVRLRRSVAEITPPAPPEELIDDMESERRCAFGLGVWLDQVGNSSRWTHLASVVPGENPTPIDSIYVDLYAISDPDIDSIDGSELETWSRRSNRSLHGEYPVVTALTMISRTLERCIVIGEPGSGKSTLVQWLARAVYKRECPDFDVAIVVKLSTFAAELAENPNVTLVEFFFDSLNTKIDDWRGASKWLRRAAAENHRFLLLLDGWDEVPPVVRDAVHATITFEQPYFTTLITSRPSGLPRQLMGRNQGSIYHIAGLAARPKEELVSKILGELGRSDLREKVIGRIRNESDLTQMAANPFLLSLLVRVLARSLDQESIPRTLSDLYQQVVVWIAETQNRARSGIDQLTSEHLRALQGLSSDLLFRSGHPRYVFHIQDLYDALDELPKDPILRSRFINRTDAVLDEYAFIHATFQEYFAALHAAKLELETSIEAAFYSISRLIVVQFIAGIGVVGGRAAVDGLVDIVVGDRNATASVVRMAVSVLRHSGHNVKALDPLGRDRLLRRLAVLPAEDERLIPIVSALEGYPLRDGAELIAELAIREDGAMELRTKALDTLASISNQELVQRIVSRIDQETRPEIVSHLLNLALSRSLAVPMDWLGGKISATRNQVKRRQFILAYFQMLPWVEPGTKFDPHELIDELMHRALSDASKTGEELADSLVRGFGLVNSGEIQIFPALVRTARRILREFVVKPDCMSTRHISLAAQICSRSFDPNVIPELKAALDKCWEGFQLGTVKDAGRLGTEIATVLGNIKLEELLTYPTSCELVESVLRGLSVRRGWLIFADKILDAEGREFARVPRDSEPIELDLKTPELNDLLKSLPQKTSKILYSYWLMVKPGSRCRPTDSMKVIYDAMIGLDSDVESDVDLARSIENVFGDDDPPSFANWRKTLERIGKRFAKKPAMLNWLEEIGLGRRRLSE